MSPPWTRAELIERAAQADTVYDLFGIASDRLNRMVPFDAAVWLATDPLTHLPIPPTRTANLTALNCDAGMQVWELEFLEADVNLYRDLARAATPAGALRLATGDRPARSPRYRRLVRPSGFEDELRGVMRADCSPWASVSLYRKAGRRAFDAREVELVASLSQPLAAAVREHARPTTAALPPARNAGTGMMLFSGDGELTFANDDALAWLEELPRDVERDTPFGSALPMVAAATLMRARAIAEQRDDRPARARIRSRTGHWLVVHASCLRNADGRIGDIALVIEPAGAAEIAPIVTQAYELSPREQQITELVARGVSTADMAGRLLLSRHTVRDYIKAIFEKVGVSTRGELVAKLFAAPVSIGM